MKINFDEFHHEKVKGIVKWITDTLPSGNITTGEAEIIAMLVHIFASIQTIEEYCIDSLEDRYACKEKED